MQYKKKILEEWDTSVNKIIHGISELNIMNHSNKLVELLLFFILYGEVLSLDLPNSLPLLLKLVDDNLHDVLNYDEPLFLSPYIESGEIEAGRSLSRVGQLPDSPNIPSYSGFFTVNQVYNSNLFFWFFPALDKNLMAPVILWLQGGPGTSGLLGLFVEHGPYVLHSNKSAGLREHTWAREFNVIYVDNPVGTGFSFTDDDNGYATNQDQITNDLYTFLNQFFKVYYEYGQNDFYIFGESYGGKHAPYLGYKLHMNGPPAKVNFKGISIGNPFIDVQSLSNIEDYYYQLGIIDSNQASILKACHKLVLENIQKGNYSEAYDEFNKCFGYFKGQSVSNSSYLTDFSGYEFYYNFLSTKRPEDYNYYISYIKLQQSRNAIHVGSLPFHDGEKVSKHLAIDVMTSSSRNVLVSLMNHYKVLVYNGQTDLIILYVLTENLLQSLKWKKSNEYKVAKRKIWRLGQGSVAGYVRRVGNVFGVLVRNAGHAAPRDQPEAVIDLITKFIKDMLY